MYNNIRRTAVSNQITYRAIYSMAQEGAYVSYIRGKRCNSEEDFFKEVSASFQFPYYFGENWPAFDECICDLDWLCFSKIFIVVEDFHSMFGGEKSLQNKLVEYFIRMIDYWHLANVPVEIWLNN